MVALESAALSLAKTIVQKAAGAWITDRRTTEVSKKELRELLTPWFRRAAPEERILGVAASDLESFGRYEFRGLDDNEREAALFAVRDAFERADLTDRALFAVDFDPAKLARRLRAGQPRAKIDAGLGEAGGAFYDAALDRCCELYVRAVLQVPAFLGRSSAEILKRVSDLPDQVADRLSDFPDQVAARVVNALGEDQAAVADPDDGVTEAGRPLEEVTDPFDLEVHRPVQPEGAPPGLPLLPPYLPREHDQVLGQVVRAAADGRGGIAVLVGGSSTGKTRACWEALALLRGQDPPWRLWHPIDPSRPDAAQRKLPGIGPRTVVWLNEAQEYLNVADGGLGERVAAGLRELLRDPARPVLVLATLWPEYWDTMTARPAAGDDPHAQARELLAGHDITVPGAFTPAQMSQLTRAADARLALAARSAPDGEVIQFLAGAPELLARYRHAPPAAAALIDAAMDARRLGRGAALPQAFLEAAAPGYLTDDQWDGLGEDWLERALAYAAVPAKGARGPLTRIRPRPARQVARGRGDQAAGMAAAAGPVYRLADYLDQYGRAHRASQVPPAEFWSAAAAHAAPVDQAALGDAARARGLYRDAAQLHKNAAASGNYFAAYYLIDSPDCLRADPRPAHWTAVHASLDYPGGVAWLLRALREAGAHEQVAVLLARDPAAHVALDDPDGLASLLDNLRMARADEQHAALLARDPAAHVALDDPDGVAELLGYLQLEAKHTKASLLRAGAHEQAAALAARAVAHASHAALDNPHRVDRLLRSLRRAGAYEQAAALAARAVAQAALDNPHDVTELLLALTRRQVAALLARDPAAHVALDDPDGVAELLFRLWPASEYERPGMLAVAGAYGQPGAHEQADALAARAAAHAALDNPHGVASLLDSMRKVGAYEQAAALAARDPAAHAALDNPHGLAELLDSLRGALAYEQAAALAARAAAHAALDNPHGVASLLDSLWRAGVYEQADALLARDPAAHAVLHDPGGVASLLDSLWRAGVYEQADALLARDPAAHVALHDPAAYAALDGPRGVAELLDRLREAGADEQATKLVGRLPAAGLFKLFLEQEGAADQFRFGREADGSPSAPWGWEDLDLWLVLRPQAP